jgi:hypothetical protein
VLSKRELEMLKIECEYYELEELLSELGSPVRSSSATPVVDVQALAQRAPTPAENIPSCLS